MAQHLPSVRCNWITRPLAFQLLLLSSLCSAGVLAGSKPRATKAELSRCEAYLHVTLASGEISAIFVADPGEFSGTPEASFIIANLKNETFTNTTTVCGGLYYGLLMGQQVLVATTGIGPTAAGLCTLDIVTACGPLIKEIFYSGTSGWSPQVGGVLNPPNCGSANTNGKVNRLGDICITPFSVNWNCKKASWTAQANGYPNQCFMPEEVAGPSAAYLYGHCQFYADNMKENLALADELLKVVRSRTVVAQMPKRSAKAAASDKMYWALMSNATGLTYTLPKPSAPPTYYDYTQCMEVDGQFFYSGAPWEFIARKYAVEVMNLALGKNLTTKDVVAVAAMEAVGVADALSKYHRLPSTKHKIPYTNVRALSNLLHQPVKKTGPGVWEDATPLPEDFVTGYAYAIASGSSTIMSFYQLRCKEDVKANRLPSTFKCAYTIAYK